ncbi:hypothetical protein ACFC0C_21955 [Streptomyces sp. NPDC056178]|uniref:hypothetical protein n=1 Tax=Streptomyces sp. NPDC056178 TaxID=3345735 RepID=UPI0035DA9161
MEHRTMLWNKNKSTLPELLRLTDPGLREQLAAMPDSKALIGLGADGQPVSVDWDTESPHVLVCSASGGGTSTILHPGRPAPAPRRTHPGPRPQADLPDVGPRHRPVCWLRSP